MSSVVRMSRIFAQDKKTFIMAMDHGANFDVLPALKDVGKVIKEIAAAGADAFLATPGMVLHHGDCFLGKGIILRIDGAVSHLGDRSKPLQIVVSPEDALRMGVDAVIAMSFPGSKFEYESLGNFSRAVNDFHRFNIPVTAEALPRGFEKADDSRAPKNITFACRQAVELGADIVKTEYTGDQESFKQLTESVYAPVVILGGSKKVPEEQMLREIKDSMQAGGAGVAMGRNIWGHENPARYAAAIAKLIHEDCSVQAALKELNGQF